MFIKNVRLMLILLVGSIASWGAGSIAAHAQSRDFYPVYYEVYNVASNDVLNVRADSDSESPIIGSLAYNASPVEVVKTEHNWGYVALNERMGWVYMKFLRQVTLPTVKQSSIPVGLRCGGTEPFWGFSVGEDTIEYSHMDREDTTFSITSAGQFAGFAGQNGFVQAAGTLSLFTAMFNANQCSDGMSDLDYGWQVDVVLSGESGAQGFSGCCRMRAGQ